MRAKLRRIYYLFLLGILFLAAGYGNVLYENRTASDAVPANASSQAKAEEVVVGGDPIGIYLKTDGVLVLGTQPVEESGGRRRSPSEGKLKSGDYILKLNRTAVHSKKQFAALLQENGEEEVKLTILRGEEKTRVKVTPVFSETENAWQIGAWIRNDTQGIGTITYIKKDGTFAALGHSVSDVELGVPLSLSVGGIYRANITSIKKGKSGSPGELVGSIDYLSQSCLGEILSNTQTGIFGKLSVGLSEDAETAPVASREEVREGNAFLRTSISGKSRDYTIKIEKISDSAKDSRKKLKIVVTDPDLLSLTGGIVQGLSGSPILQDGKLVGAVTHVFVDDPTRGYGILIEDMGA